MALQWKSGKLGCSYYTQEYRELHVMDDVIERSPEDFATQCTFLYTLDDMSFNYLISDPTSQPKSHSSGVSCR